MDLKIDIKLLFHTINFAILYFFIKKFFYEKVAKIVENRETLIKKGIEKIASVEEIISKKENESKQKIEDSQNKSKKIIKNAQEVSVNLMKNSSKEISIEMKNEMENLSNKLKKIERDWESQHVNLILDIAQQITFKVTEKEINIDKVKYERIIKKIKNI